MANVFLKPPRRGTLWAPRREIARRGMAVEEPVPEPVVLEELGGDPRPFVTRRRLGSAPEVRSRHPGAFFRIEFAAPVAGRLAFGFACHLGLGLFRHDRAGER